MLASTVGWRSPKAPGGPWRYAVAGGKKHGVALSPGGGGAVIDMFPYAGWGMSDLLVKNKC